MLNSVKEGNMHSSVIGRSVLIVIALLVLASCDHRGSKVEADKTKGSKSETTSQAKPATKTATAHNSKVASASTSTALKNIEFNGITQFGNR